MSAHLFGNLRWHEKVQGAIRGVLCVLNVHAEGVYFYTEQPYFYAAGTFLHRTAVFLVSKEKHRASMKQFTSFM